MGDVSELVTIVLSLLLVLLYAQWFFKKYTFSKKNFFIIVFKLAVFLFIGAILIGVGMFVGLIFGLAMLPETPLEEFGLSLLWNVDVLALISVQAYFFKRFFLQRNSGGEFKYEKHLFYALFVLIVINFIVWFEPNPMLYS